MALAIIILVIIGVFSDEKESIAEKSCQASRYSILRTYYHLKESNPDVTLEQVLENENSQYYSEETGCPDGGVYSVVDGVITCSIHGSSFIDVSTSASYKYDFSGMTDDELNAILELALKQSNDKWSVNDINGEVVLTNETTGENRIFFPIDLVNYTINSTITLSGSDGYGIMVESFSDDYANDTGYVFQFDSSYNQGAFIFRERNNGIDYSPFEVLNPADVIKDYDRNTFWNETHLVKIEIISYSRYENEMKVFIDDDEITANSTIILSKPTDDSQTYVGFRAWGKSGVQIKDLEVFSN
ncbi:MAG: hypothetical protein JXQ23_04220 [Clostridia bacterium]|nr:hypothetical protein [Clostridia bacterium]